MRAITPSTFETTAATAVIQVWAAQLRMQLPLPTHTWENHEYQQRRLC
jgi:hypothetical protein